MTGFENLNKFFEKVKTISFWQRIFNWGEIKRLSYDAFEEYIRFRDSFAVISEKLGKTEHKIEIINRDIEHLKTTNVKLEAKLEPLSQKNTELSNENTRFKQTEEIRKKEYNKNIIEVNKIKEQLDSDRKRVQEDRETEIRKRFEAMKETWAEHENNIKNIIKAICNNHVIDYVEDVPFKGKPDNTIQICNEFIIFDAKSPASDNLDNFPNYIKVQTESVKKYIQQENVKKDIFLVIPSNTVAVIKRFTYNMGDYNVFIITADALEPIVLSLKKIEEYEFAEQLSPEERDNICRIIGKFAHTTKRKIQIDHWFTNEFLEILTKCKNDLPSEILEKVIEFELADKLNPPMEKRAKQILTKDLQDRNQSIQQEANAKGIVAVQSDQIKKLPLYKDENQ